MMFSAPATLNPNSMNAFEEAMKQEAQGWARDHRGKYNVARSLRAAARIKARKAKRKAK